MPKTAQKLTERIAFDLTCDELRALDAYCAAQRRATGDPVPRAGVVREAVRRLTNSDVGLARRDDAGGAPRKDEIA